MLVYCALAGEYEVTTPLGIFKTEKEARKCIKESNPRYSTEILIFDLNSGSQIAIINWTHPKDR